MHTTIHSLTHPNLLLQVLFRLLHAEAGDLLPLSSEREAHRPSPSPVIFGPQSSSGEISLSFYLPN
jgi:hypothetical protein